MMGNLKRCRILILAVFMTVAIGIGPAYAAVTTYNSPDVPKDIVSHDPPVASTITVPCGGSIIDVNVRLDITHTYDQDLAVFLIAPDGTMIELSTQNGGSGENYSDTIFDDEAATAITAGTAPFTGSYQPESPLAALDGMEMGVPGPCR